MMHNKIMATIRNQ